MEELPNIIPSLKVVWNKHKVIPPTSTHTITITLDTSVDVQSIREWLKDSLEGTLASISQSTGANEKLISINNERNTVNTKPSSTNR